MIFSKDRNSVNFPKDIAHSPEGDVARREDWSNTKE
jgi:hypothetical protein